MVETFYATLAQICFALVGLWWVVVQFKYDLLMSSPSGRLAAYIASMHFIAPGVISLISVLVSDDVGIWRLGSLIGSVLGIVATIAALRAALMTRAQRIIEVMLLVLFAVIAILSFVTTPLFGVKPIMIDALVNVGVITLGVQYAWLFFAGGMVKKN
jgi:hypothetical protein